MARLVRSSHLLKSAWFLCSLSLFFKTINEQILIFLKFQNHKVKEQHLFPSCLDWRDLRDSEFTDSHGYECCYNPENGNSKSKVDTHWEISLEGKAHYSANICLSNSAFLESRQRYITPNSEEGFTNNFFKISYLNWNFNFGPVLTLNMSTHPLWNHSKYSTRINQESNHFPVM